MPISESVKNVLVIDDQNFRLDLIYALKKDGYTVQGAASIQEALDIVKKEAPLFILADRMLEGERIEQEGIKLLRNAAINSWIVVYTRGEDLSLEDEYTILHRGAFRVMEKEKTDKMLSDVRVVTREFEELLELKKDLQFALIERSRIFSTLLGANVATCVIDRSYLCWFANAAMQTLADGPCSDGVYWKTLFDYHENLGPNWGCTVKDVIDTKRPVERLRFMRFKGSNFKWFSIRATPIMREQIDDIVAVHEAAMEVSEDVLSTLTSESRLQKLAQSIIWLGFGRARIYTTEAGLQLSLVMAASASDSSQKPESDYFNEMRNTRLDSKACPYVKDAIDRKCPIIVDSWPNGIKSPHAEQLNLEPPYCLIPLFDGDISIGLLAADCVGLSELKRKFIEGIYLAKEMEFPAFSITYATEVSQAILSRGVGRINHAFREAVQHARIRVGGATSLDDARKTLLNALQKIIPDSSIVVRMLRGEVLERCASLCNELQVNVPDVIPRIDAHSFSSYVVRTMRCLSIENYQTYKQCAAQQALPVTRYLSDFKSAIFFPLIVEGQVIGSLGITSQSFIRWEEAGYIEPLQTLANFVALVLRDIILIENEKFTRSALRESEETFRKLFEEAPVGYHELDANGRITRVNKTELDLLGYHKTEMEGTFMSGFMREGKEADDWKMAFSEMIKGRSMPPDPHAVTLIKRNGRPIPVLMYHSLIRDTSKNIRGVRSTMRDLSFGIHPEGIIIDLLVGRLSARSDLTIYVLHKDKEHKLTYVNEAYKEKLQPALRKLGKQSFLGLKDDELFPNEADQYKEDDKYVTQTGRIKESIEFHHPLDGVGTYVQVIKAPIRDFKNNIIGVQAVFWDVKDHEKVQDTLEIVRHEYQAFFENAITGVFQSNPEGKFLNVNPTLARMLGYESPKDLLEMADIGKEFFVDGARREEMLRTLRADGTISDFEFECRTKGGGRLWVSECARALFGKDTQLQRIEGTIENISERKKNERIESAEGANRAKSLFLALMSHEIRTPMNAMLVASQLIARSSGLTSEVKEYLEIIAKSGDDLLALINDILEVSKIEAGQFRLSPEPFDFHALMEQMERNFRARADQAGLKFIVEKASDVPEYIYADKRRLERIFTNLLENAVKFTPQGCITLRINAIVKDEKTLRLQVEVEDTGKGIDDKEVESLFQPFEQASAGIAAGTGTGLGLLLCREYTKMMGGNIAVKRTELGKGTCFSFEINIEVAANAKLPSRNFRQVIGLHPNQKPPRILIVDDNAIHRRLLSKLLTNVGFLVLEAANGQDGIDQEAEWCPDLIFMDMKMPGIGGQEVIRRIKRSRSEKGPAIIALTASAFEEDREEILAAGADSYIRKPSQGQELFSTIGSLLMVEYLYQEENSLEMDDLSSFVTDTPFDALVKTMSSDLTKQIREAAQAADYNKLFILLDQVAQHNVRLADKLKSNLLKYDYKGIIESTNI